MTALPSTYRHKRGERLSFYDFSVTHRILYLYAYDT